MDRYKCYRFMTAQSARAIEALECLELWLLQIDPGAPGGYAAPLLIQCLATPGSARENIVSVSSHRDSAQEAVELP